MKYGIGPLPAAVFDDEPLWKAVWRNEVERAGCTPAGEPTAVLRHETFGFTDGEGIHWPPGSGVFVEGPVTSSSESRRCNYIRVIMDP